MASIYASQWSGFTHPQFDDYANAYSGYQSQQQMSQLAQMLGVPQKTPAIRNPSVGEFEWLRSRVSEIAWKG